jgi:hypothetical protein
MTIKELKADEIGAAAGALVERVQRLAPVPSPFGEVLAPVRLRRRASPRGGATPALFGFGGIGFVRPAVTPTVIELAAGYHPPA